MVAGIPFNKREQAASVPVNRIRVSSQQPAARVVCILYCLLGTDLWVDKHVPAVLYCCLLQTEGNRVPGKPRYRELSSKGSEASQAAEAAAYARSWHDSLVDDLFGGQLQSTVTCSSCGQRSHQFDPMLDLSVPLPKSSKYRPVSLQVGGTEGRGGQGR